MAYEYPTTVGVLHLLRVDGRWAVELKGRLGGRWMSPDRAAVAVAEHRSGLAEWDGTASEAPGDLMDWRPLGDSL